MSWLSEIFGYILNFFYNLTNNYGLAIIIFSFLLRLILIPITMKQQKAMKTSARLQEKMREIQTKYKHDPEKLNQETINLYKTEKFGPFSGCFTAILQLLIILSVFFLVSQPLTHMKKAYKSEDTEQIMKAYIQELEEEGTQKNYPEIQIIAKIEEDYKEITEKIANKEGNEITESEESKENIIDEQLEDMEDSQENTSEQQSEETLDELKTKRDILEKLRINMNFLGLDLSKVPTQNLGDWKVYVIPILYVITSFVSIKLTTMTQKKKNTKKDIITEEGKDASDEMVESIQQMNNSMSYMMPIMSISIAAIAPLGLALYWFVSNILIIIERLFINKFIANKGEKEDE